MTRNHDDYVRFIKSYWSYYRELEEEFMATRKYVDFQKDNFGTYSVEFLKLYQAVCSEIDVIGKEMAYQINNAFKPEDTQNNIIKWWYEIQGELLYKEKYEDITTSGVLFGDVHVCMLDEFDISPWAGFETEQYLDKKNALRYRTKDTKGTPKWWSAYNKVKHSRTYKISKDSVKSNYTRANLGNVCHAFAALYILEKSYMQSIGTKNDLESFSDFSMLFDKVERITTDDIDAMFAETMKQ